MFVSQIVTHSLIENKNIINLPMETSSAQTNINSSLDDSEYTAEEVQKFSYLNDSIEDLLSKISKITKQHQNTPIEPPRVMSKPIRQPYSGLKFSNRSSARRQKNTPKVIVSSFSNFTQKSLQLPVTEGIHHSINNVQNERHLKHQISIKILPEVPSLDKNRQVLSMQQITPERREPCILKSLRIDSLFNRTAVREVAQSRIIDDYQEKNGKKLDETRHTFSASHLKSSIYQELSLKDFEIIKEVGAGKFGQVYLCKHKETGGFYALKKLFKSAIKQYKMENQFTNEIKALYYLDHPNIIKLYAHFHDEYHVFLLMEYVQGGELVKKLKSNEKYVSKVLDQMIDAVQYLHNKGVIHRDIKPQNIIISFDNTIKLCDFGWAGFFDHRALKTTFCGTLDYLSPEMKQKGQYSSQVDLWSLGVLAFQMITGSSPFKDELASWRRNGNTKNSQWDWHILYPPDMSGLAESFIRGLLKQNPNERATIRYCKQHFFIKKYRQHMRMIEIPMNLI